MLESELTFFLGATYVELKQLGQGDSTKKY